MLATRPLRQRQPMANRNPLPTRYSGMCVVDLLYAPPAKDSLLNPNHSVAGGFARARRRNWGHLTLLLPDAAPHGQVVLQKRPLSCCGRRPMARSAVRVSSVVSSACMMPGCGGVQVSYLQRRLPACICMSRHRDISRWRYPTAIGSAA